MIVPNISFDTINLNSNYIHDTLENLVKTIST